MNMLKARDVIKENTIKVTSITYVKNCAEYIEKCLRSIMDQTLQQIEILVCDGGSSDGTLEIIERLMKTDDRIRLFRTEGSVGLQFNTALREARGEYTAICEGDDYILPDKYEYLYRLMVENNLDVCRSGCYAVVEKGDIEFRYRMGDSVPSKMFDRIMYRDDNPMLFLRTGVNLFFSGMYRTKFLIDNGIRMNETKGASYQDIGFSFLAQYYAERYCFTEKVLHCYRIDNLNASFFYKDYEDRCKTEYALLKENLIKRGLFEECKIIFDEWYGRSIEWGKHQRLVDTNPLFGFFKNEYLPKMKIAVVGMGPGYKQLVDYLRHLRANAVYSGINPLYAIIQFGVKDVVSLPEIVKNEVDKVIAFPSSFTDGTLEKLSQSGIGKDKILLFDEPYFFLRYIFAAAN